MKGSATHPAPYISLCGSRIHIRLVFAKEQIDNDDVHKNFIPLLDIVTVGFERISLPPLIRPAVPHDQPDEALVLWGTNYYSYSVIAHLQQILRGLVEVIRLGNVSTAFVVCRHVFEWTANTCYISMNLKTYIRKGEWERARALQTRAMEGNKWIKDHGHKYLAPVKGDTVPDPLEVANIVGAYEGYLKQTYGEANAKDSYGLLSEHSHANSACFTRYCKFYGPEVRFVKPSTDMAILGEERHLIHLLLFLNDLLELGKETKVRRQLRATIDDVLEAAKKHQLVEGE
jgi:hypothetical protein